MRLKRQPRLGNFDPWLVCCPGYGKLMPRVIAAYWVMS